MAVRHGYGKIAGADALVFAYDTGDTRNSYKGEPTENLLNDTTEFGSWTKARNSGTTPTVTSNTSPNPLGIPNAPMADTLVIPDDGTYPRIQQYFTPTSTNQHTMSVWIRSLSGDCDCFLGIFRNIPWSLPGHTVVSVTSEWQRFSFTMTPPDTTTHVAYIGSHDTAAQKGNTLELWGAMIEENSHVTPFTAGTRSATQGLLDLTGNYTLDISNASFDSNAFIAFDGSSDYIDILNSTALFSGTQDFTVEAAYNMEGQGGGEIFGNYGSGHTTDHLWFSGMYGLWINGGVYAPGAPLANGRYHMVGTRKNGLVELYLNGELVNSGTRNASIATDINYRIGADVNGAGEPFTGDIFVVKAYNRALTAAEVKNNFNNYKGRFNL